MFPFTIGLDLLFAHQKLNYNYIDCLLYTNAKLPNDTKVELGRESMGFIEHQNMIVASDRLDTMKEGITNGPGVENREL
jgi:hypothetical protein